MRGLRRITGAAPATITVACVLAGTAHGSSYGIELNGTYRVTSNGVWAQTNERYANQNTVVQSWTITSTCEDPMECTGQVHSDQGWSAPLRYLDDHWIVDREISGWEPCADGTTAAGAQKYMFWGVGKAGTLDSTNTGLLAGIDETFGPSGACGVNKPLVIRMPLRLDRT